ncbi:septum site-determining protein MinC [Aestuariicella hydrocarbonica]|uniref:Probable septum site-determining protein MinC n=2 Tax=Pseudomaricurvus hydrocarbonicus TaxID=1470433 RepID=A0A9E5JS77_9GAMM|nr:septum site-determining protein MinC [Aestuariicella hydrocarbonica]
MDQPSSAPSFRLKGGLFPLTLIELANGDLQRLRTDLTLKVAEAPSFFQQAPAVLSLELFEDDAQALDLQAIQQLCLEFGLIIVALRGADEALQATAKELNLAILANSRTKPVVALEPSAEKEPSAQEEPSAAKEPSTQEQSSAAQGSSDDSEESVTDDLFSPVGAPALETGQPATDSTGAARSAPVPTKVITTPVRSGQQIYAAGGDLIVLAPVSAGAELLADGNIHVYGPLRGRALAGVNGNTEARVFCQSLEAELISIAGYFRVNEDLRDKHWKKSVQASLTDETLNIEPLR